MLWLVAARSTTVGPRPTALRDYAVWTLPGVLVASDLATALIPPGAALQFALGIAVPLNLLLLAVVTLIALFPAWYGAPLIFLLAALPALLLTFVIAYGARVLVYRSMLEVHRVLDEPGRAGTRAWGAGLLAAPFVLAIGCSPIVANRYVDWHPTAPPAAPAVHVAWAIEACAQRYAAAHAGTFPPTLNELGPSGTRCLTRLPMEGRVDGWRVLWRGVGQPQLVIREHVHPFATYRSYSIDQSGTLRGSGYASRDAGAHDPAIASPPRRLQQIRECMQRLLRSGRRLPTSLYGMYLLRANCPILDGAVWNVGGDSNVAETRVRFVDTPQSEFYEVYRYAYRPWLNSDGGVDSAVVTARPSSYGTTGLRSYSLTPDGSVRATPEDRAANEHDPAVPLCASSAAYACAESPVPTNQGISTLAAAFVRVQPTWKVTLAAVARSNASAAAPTLLVTRDDVVVVTGRMGTFAYDATGVKQWERPDIEPRVAGATAAADGVVIIDSAATLHALDTSGRERWRAPVGISQWLPPVVLHGMTYVGGGRALTAFTPRGDRAFTATVDGFIEDAAGAADGGIYLFVDGPPRLEHFTKAGVRDATVAADSLTHCSAGERGPSLTACSRSAPTFHARLDRGGASRFLHSRLPMGQAPLPLHFLRASQINAKGTAFVVDYEQLRAIAPDSSQRWDIARATEVPSDEVSGAVVTPAGDVAFVVSRLTNLTTLEWSLDAYDDEGAPRWTAILPGRPMYSRPALGRRGMLYIVSSDWVLIAFQSPR